MCSVKCATQKGKIKPRSDNYAAGAGTLAPSVIIVVNTAEAVQSIKRNTKNE